MVAATALAPRLQPDAPPMPRRIHTPARNPHSISERRKALAAKSGIHERLLIALEAIEVPDCRCKLSMVPVCLVLRLHGCRQRRNSGDCSCRLRMLPRCQLKHKGGCERRREGKPCECGLAEMPECLSPGCNRRQRGKLCDCPRWPGEPCSHVTSFAARMRFYSAALILESCSQDGSDPDSGWCFLLYRLWPKRYRGPRKLGAPKVLLDRETRVAKMEQRRAANLQLYHPLDIRHPHEEEVGRRLSRNAQAFATLLDAERGVSRG